MDLLPIIVTVGLLLWCTLGDQIIATFRCIRATINSMRGRHK